MSIRLIDAGLLPCPRSQTIYHGVAHARTDTSPDTVIFAVPGDPYVCIGLHQDLEREIDVDYCRQHGLPVVRREVGGGAVYIDSDQLFVQWVMGPGRLPLRVDDRFALFAEPLVATYREIGIEARFRPVNDIRVAGKKIGGTGAARIGDAEVLVGNFIFDFDTGVMAQVLRVSSDGMRDRVHRGLDAFMTTIDNEVDEVPDVETVKSIYRRECAKTLGDDLADGELSDDETATMARLDAKFSSEAFVHQPGGLTRHGVKIHQDVWVRESSRESAAGRIAVAARVREGRLEDVSLAGDVVAAGLESALTGVEIRREVVTEIVVRHGGNTAPGPTAADWVEAIMGLRDGGERS